MCQFHPNKCIHELVIITIGLRIGVISHQRLIDFSDDIIFVEVSTHPLFIDIALSSSNKNSLISILNQFIVENQKIIDEKALISIIGYQYKKQSFSLEEAIMILYKLSLEYILDEQITSTISRLDDQYHLISNGYIVGSMDQFEEELSSFFAKHHLNQQLFILS